MTGGTQRCSIALGYLPNSFELFFGERGILFRGAIPDIPREIQVMVSMTEPHLEFALAQFFFSSFFDQSLKFFDRFGQIAPNDFKIHALPFRRHDRTLGPATSGASGK
jgi:hypothetical protein